MEHLLSNFTALANEHSLEYWMCAGTLLGAVRDGGFIPWDDDVDLCAHSRMLDRLVNESAVQLSCARSGIVIGFSDDIYRVSFAKSDQGVYLDIFEMEVHYFARARSQYFNFLLLCARSVSRALVPVYLGSCSRSVLTQLSHSLALFPLFLAQTHTYTRTRTHTHTDTHQLEKPCCLSFTQVCTFFCTWFFFYVCVRFLVTHSTYLRTWSNQPHSFQQHGTSCQPTTAWQSTPFSAEVWRHGGHKSVLPLVL